MAAHLDMSEHPDYAMYAVSKTAVSKLTKSIKLQLAKDKSKIRVSVSTRHNYVWCYFNSFFIEAVITADASNNYNYYCLNLNALDINKSVEEFFLYDYIKTQNLLLLRIN